MSAIPQDLTTLSHFLKREWDSNPRGLSTQGYEPCKLPTTDYLAVLIRLIYIDAKPIENTFSLKNTNLILVQI